MTATPPHRPYPPVVYTGETGEASTWIRRADSPPDLTHHSGSRCEYLATGDQTEGRFGLYRWTFGVEESGPSPHFHRTISEQFLVLTGRVQIHDGNEWQAALPGDFVYVPPGGIHGFRGANHASMLLMFAPGAPREGYFETLARGDVMTEEERDLFMAHHDNWRL